MREASVPSGLYFLPADAAIPVDFAVDLSRLKKTSSILRHLGEALSFPDWYGNNLDALFDCLSDPEWPGTGQATLVRLHGLQNFAAQSPDDCASLLEVLQAASEAQADSGQTLHIVIDLPAADVPRWPAA